MSVHRCCNAISRHARRGLTLVEVLAVVAILGLIAGIVALNFSGAFGKAKRETAKTGISLVTSRLELYRLDRGSLPSNELGLAALSEGHAKPTDSFWLNPDQLVDPWGRPFEYIAPGPNGHEYEVVSFGADGLRGGQDSDADLSSTELGRDNSGSSNP